MIQLFCPLKFYHCVTNKIYTVGTYFVTLKTRRSLRARKAESPKDPARSRTWTQITSKIDPTITMQSKRLKAEEKQVVRPRAYILMPISKTNIPRKQNSAQTGTANQVNDETSNSQYTYKETQSTKWVGYNAPQPQCMCSGKLELSQTRTTPESKKHHFQRFVFPANYFKLSSTGQMLTNQIGLNSSKAKGFLKNSYICKKIVVISKQTMQMLHN